MKAIAFLPRLWRHAVPVDGSFIAPRAPSRPTVATAEQPVSPSMDPRLSTVCKTRPSRSAFTRSALGIVAALGAGARFVPDADGRKTLRELADYLDSLRCSPGG